MTFDVRQPFINLWAVWVLAAILVRQSIKQNNFFVIEMKKIAWDVKRIADNIDKTSIDGHKALIIFNSVMGQHITEKLRYLQEILIRNNIKERRPQIEKNIKTEVLQITQKELGRLSNFVLHNWYSLDTPLAQVDLQFFLKDLYEIFFAEEKDVIKKIQDIRQMMEWYVNDLRYELRKNF